MSRTRSERSWHGWRTRGDVDVQIELGVALDELLVSCDTLEHEVGLPPTVRLDTINNLLNQACPNYESAAPKIARGLDSRSEGLISAALRDVQTAGDFLEGATREKWELQRIR